MTGRLVLIPTPIDDQSPLEPTAHAMLMKAALERPEHSVFAIEDLKPGRARWLSWGLPREVVDDFVLYNEHTREEIRGELLERMYMGSDVYLMSDGGLPAFCDPGRHLVAACHRDGLSVTSTPFPNSTLLALALSGFDHNEFLFKGFLPVEKGERKKALGEIAKRSGTIVLMETPYRLTRLLEELNGLWKGQAFMALDLCMPSQELILGSISDIARRCKGQKREFVLILSR